MDARANIKTACTAYVQGVTITNNNKGDSTMNENVNMNDVITNAANICGYVPEIIEDYHDGYICDTFAEIADTNTSIYYSDIIKFISDNVEAVNDAICELGWDGCGSDLYKAGQAAEYMQIEHELYEHSTEIIEAFAADYLRNVYGDTIPVAMWETIADELESIDTNDTWDNIRDIVNDAIKASADAETATA